ncbi:MAG: S8 family serine peptidase [Pseudomonadota bacterium]|nr:S8 family serine peptidase [Pseudomonadota bacterium]
MRTLYVCVALLFGLISACSEVPTGETKLISGRSQFETIMVLVELQTPPLLATATMDSAGNRKVDPMHLRTLQQEQQDTLTKFKRLSQDIKVIYTYSMTLNGFALLVPRPLLAQLGGIAAIRSLHKEAVFARPEFVDVSSRPADGDDDDDQDKQDKIEGPTSVSYIDSHKVHENLKILSANNESVAVRGQGIRVAIVDTGIDYYHKMFGGSGVVADYKNDNPTIVEPGSFPTAKVIAGIDLVGNKYDPSSVLDAQRIPNPDADPLDEGMHGTHVAGTVAGIGDDINTYSGVAPDASLYAVKVFGAGATGESVILKALDYSIDPNGDYNLDDQAHVVNMSLGSPYGGDASIYDQVVNLMTANGTVVVASAGNSGKSKYIVGSPSVSDSAISVAASVDNSDHNWKLPGINFNISADETITLEAVDSSIGKPYASIEMFTANLHYIGLADKDLTEEEAAAVSGKVALIDRGLVTFDDKVTRAADAGATAVIVINNIPGPPLAMGGDKSFDIPALMVRKEGGEQVKTALAASPDTVTVTFDNSILIERPDLIDKLTSFSSRGPRSIDALIKPEVAAPGLQITSARAGSGMLGLRASGTSMSAPHVAGVAALMRQYRPSATAAMVKAAIIGTAKDMEVRAGERYPVASQGGGRVNAYDVVTADTMLLPSTLSLGKTTVAKKKQLAGHFTLLNFSDEKRTFTFKVKAADSLQFTLPASVTLAANQRTRVNYRVLVNAENLTASYTNLDGYIETYVGSRQVARMPLLLGVQRFSRVDVNDAVIHASSSEDAQGALVDITLNNHSNSDGNAHLFNLLAMDARRAVGEASNAYPCDIESAGYRVVDTPVTEDKTIPALEIAVKYYHPLTTWHHCLTSVQFDADHDGVAEQELLGGMALPYFTEHGSMNRFLAILADAEKVRAARAQYESGAIKTQDYRGAIISYLGMNHLYDDSTLMITAVDLSKLARTAAGSLRIKITSISPFADYYYYSDDTLMKGGSDWLEIYPAPDGSGFWDIPSLISVPRNGHKSFSLIKGGDVDGQLIAYFPHNATTFSRVRSDFQSQVIDLTNAYLAP